MGEAYVSFHDVECIGARPFRFTRDGGKGGEKLIGRQFAGEPHHMQGMHPIARYRNHDRLSAFNDAGSEVAITHRVVRSGDCAASAAPLLAPDASGE